MRFTRINSRLVALAALFVLSLALITIQIA